MPNAPTVATRQRWFLGWLFALMGATVLVAWADLPPLAWSLGVLILSIASFAWLVRGPSWVVAAGPPRDAEVIAAARRFGRRVMMVVVVARVAVEVVWWMIGGDSNGTGLFASPIRTAFGMLIVAYAIGRVAEYNWLRRPPQPPMPWVVRVLMR